MLKWTSYENSSKVKPSSNIKITTINTTFSRDAETIEHPVINILKGTLPRDSSNLKSNLQRRKPVLKQARPVLIRTPPKNSINDTLKRISERNKFSSDIDVLNCIKTVRLLIQELITLKTRILKDGTVIIPKAALIITFLEAEKDKETLSQCLCALDSLFADEPQSEATIIKKFNQLLDQITIFFKSCVASLRKIFNCKLEEFSSEIDVLHYITTVRLLIQELINVPIILKNGTMIIPKSDLIPIFLEEKDKKTLSQCLCALDSLFADEPQSERTIMKKVNQLLDQITIYFRSCVAWLRKIFNCQSRDQLESESMIERGNEAQDLSGNISSGSNFLTRAQKTPMPQGTLERTETSRLFISARYTEEQKALC